MVKNGIVYFYSVKPTDDKIKELDQVYIIACGSAYHVDIDLQYVIESLASISVRVELASKFRYREMILKK